MSRKITFEQAKSRYVHRFTMEHVPQWTHEPHNGKFYAPQYRTDQEWYDRSLFAGESDLATNKYCYSGDPTWPLGAWLNKPYSR